MWSRSKSSGLGFFRLVRDFPPKDRGGHAFGGALNRFEPQSEPFKSLALKVERGTASGHALFLSPGWAIPALSADQVPRGHAPQRTTSASKGSGPGPFALAGMDLASHFRSDAAKPAVMPVWGPGGQSNRRRRAGGKMEKATMPQ